MYAEVRVFNDNGEEIIEKQVIQPKEVNLTDGSNVEVTKFVFEVSTLKDGIRTVQEEIVVDRSRSSVEEEEDI